MKALILCAGYATRLYPLTMNQPKQLLSIADRPMLDYTIDNLNQIDEIDEIYMVTNQKFYQTFVGWSKKVKTKKKMTVFNDGTSSDGTKLGAIGDMKFVIDNAKVNDDLLVLAGDNLFQLDLKKFISFFKEKATNSICLKDVGLKDLISKYSEVELDKDQKVINFTEKPTNPKTTLAAVCIYLFAKNKIQLVNKYMSEGNNPDQPGRYIQWLHKADKVYGFVFYDKWYDIGDLNQYKEADEDYKAMRGNK
ncbi:MAG: nucleotidyltransferase family protein [Elusimicrobia bacterium]|nr:nucleotidyltransferase family protein [Elusimicrobiota bacterium]MBU2615456.1 nucleotidyltransferase family protein [Elusimicrobiota bacterium]